MTTPKPLIIVIWTSQEMMSRMTMELIGSLDVIMLNFALWKMRKFHEFYPSPDDHPKTFDYHHLDMSRDDGMDENGIDWFCGCHLVEFWLGSWANGR
jgi:hypothetical protein